MKKQELENQVAIVTGGASGIGQATACLLAERGATVVVADLNREKGARTAREIEAAGGRSIFVAADVSVAADTERLVQEGVKAFGGIDILVNNAAVLRFNAATETPEAEWDLVLGASLKSVFLCSKAAIPVMLKRGGGSIVNTASVHSYATGPRYAAYATAKGGVLALTRQLAVDYSPKGIRVNCVCPGAIDTPMLKSGVVLEPDPVKAYKDWGDMHLLKRLGRPEEVAEVIVFLASGRSSFVTGSAYLVDGGLLAQL